MSIYETEQRARAQGFYFGVELEMSRHKQLGSVLWSTIEEARTWAQYKVKECDASGFRLYRVSLNSPFRSEAVE
jgi:hypothetical protein